MDHFSKQLLNTDETGPEEHTREGIIVQRSDGEYCLRLYSFKSCCGCSQVMCICVCTVGGTVVRRGERSLRRHLGEITKPSRGRGCLRTDLEAVGRTPDYISSGQGVTLT